MSLLTNKLFVRINCRTPASRDLGARDYKLRTEFQRVVQYRDLFVDLLKVHGKEGVEEGVNIFYEIFCVIRFNENHFKLFSEYSLTFDLDSALLNTKFS